MVGVADVGSGVGVVCLSTGGKRFDVGSEYYATLMRWLEAGAPNDAVPTPKVEKVELYPPSAVLEGADATQQFIARAVYADGTDRDVTDLAVFLTNNDNSAPINPDGMVTAAASRCNRRYAWHAAGTASLLRAKLGGSEMTMSQWCLRSIAAARKAKTSLT